MDKYDSIYFLSQITDEQMCNQTLGIMRKSFDMDKYINHLRDSEKMNIVRYNEKEEFLRCNPDVHYENDKTTEPRCDLLYSKINEYYFVENTNYFQKYTEFYFTLYSAIFPKMGLDTINLHVSHIIDNNHELSADLDFIVANLGISSNNAQSSCRENNINMKFIRDEKDLVIINSLNELDGIQKIEFIYKNVLPVNLRKKLYYKSLYDELPYINQCLNGLKQITTNKIVKNTNTKAIKIKLAAIFSGFDVGLNGEYSEENHINNKVTYNLEFYELNNLIIEPEKETIPEQCVVPTPTPKYEMNLYTSLAPTTSGPWPINCTEEAVNHNINTLNEAKTKAKYYINKDPQNSIIEIVENFTFPVTWTYTVKLFKRTNQTADVHVGNGRRYVAFDSNKFSDKDNVFNTLKKNGYY